MVDHSELHPWERDTFGGRIREVWLYINTFTLTNTLAVYYTEAHQKELANCNDNHVLPMEKKCFFAVISE